ncbi:hypothetical protein HBH98_244190 [Parastagonospora nodorum]|nr:hypothetical protein HBH53_230350 [Parastagonospora nodorum]KAH3956367.1 hypothetical protein HBH51_243700 [Parastagonospora nodorum]KAH4215541.1 hypothetical protein HBI06_247750 [Parastagonospora nodorum]KAH4224210.1 hypothetical protein HBI05_241900 [Parastagonospora nodorum]KAH4334271.1 hypothetical protein HBH98_244190 [Parastagonospora nodorum]
MDLSDLSPHQNLESADRNETPRERTTSGSIEAPDDDLFMVGADGLQLFETELGTDVENPARQQEQLPWLRLCLPVTSGGCEILTVYLNLDEPQVEVALFQAVFIPVQRTRAHPQTLEKLAAEVVAFHTACAYILVATYEMPIRAAILGASKKVESATLIDFMHCDVVNRHQARMLTASPSLRCSLPEVQAVTSAACQILRACEIQRACKTTTDSHDLHGDGPSDMEIVSMTRKGANMDGGGGTVHTRWTGEPPATGAPSFKVHAIGNQLHHALLVVNFGDLAMEITIEKAMEYTFMQRLPDLLGTSSLDSRVSAGVMQSFYHAIVLHHQATQKESYNGSPQEYVNNVACYMLNEWSERYQDHQKDADMAEHVVFLDAIFRLAAQIEVKHRYEGPVNVLEARGERG